VKPKPEGLKVQAGTARKDRARQDNTVAFPVVKNPQAPPDYLTTDDAIAMWRDTEPMLRASGVLTEDNLRPLGLLCALFGRAIQKLRADMTPSASDVAQIRALFSLFGMTPSDRLSLTKPPEKPANAFNRNGQKSG
jgi:phage terminase small subunit